jgi:hypothetical protein
MGDPAKIKEENEWFPLDGDEGEADRIPPEAIDAVNLAEGEYSLLPQEFLTETEAVSPQASETNESLLQKLQKMTLPQKLKLALFGNLAVRNILIHDRNQSVALSVLRNPKLQESEVLSFAQSKNISDDVLQAIARDRNWIKNYAIKLALVSNPKTPLPTSIRFLDHLHDRDLQNLARSRSVSSVLSRTAGRVLAKRKGSR